MPEIKKMTAAEFQTMMDSVPYLPLGCFYLEDGGKIIGVDNSDGHAWTEEFDDFESCERWLNGDGDEWKGASQQNRREYRMKASDIVEDALQSRGVLQKELAGRIGQQPKTLSKKLSTNSMKAQELVDYIRELGYEIALVDRLGNERLTVRRRGIGPRVRKMVDGVIYDTQKADAICHTDVENGWYIELYQDANGRFFAAHYSFWPEVDPFITRCPSTEAEALRQKYAE